MKKSILLIASVLASAGLFWACQGKTGDTAGNTSNDEEELRCSCPHVHVSLQPYDDFTQGEALQLKKELENNLAPLMDEIALTTEVLPNKPLDDSLKNEGKTRYRADKIIKTLEKQCSKEHIIIALTHKDVSVPYKGRADWGVLGLSLIPKKACVVSTYRLKNRKHLWRLTAHEFIHTCFTYQHCPNDIETCIMKDAKGHANFSNKTGLCKTCQKEILKRF